MTRRDGRTAKAARLKWAATALAGALVAGPALAAEPAGDWRSYGRDVGGQHYSPLTEITPANVSRLATRWTYDLGPAAGGEAARRLPSQMTPLAVGGVVYIPTPYGKIVALDGDTGREVWSYTLPDGDTVVGRGIEYWPGDGTVGPRILFGTRSGRLAAVDADTGRAPAGFSPINLKTPEVMNGDMAGGHVLNSAPIVYRHLVITGSRVQENPALGPNGDVRAWDIRTGRLAWTFHTIPQPGEFGHETWEDAGWRRRSGVNVWNLMSVDAQRGIVFLPVSAPAYDRIGIDRKGANLFSSTLVAVDAMTGKRLWHFQTVHHDIWDHDTAVQPALVEVRKGGRTIPAVLVTNKTGLIFILDRVTGKPVYEVKETPVPPSTLAGETAWPTQPIPVAPPPVSRQFATINDIATVTPEHEAFCRKRVADEKLTFAAPFEPLRGDHATVRFPGSGGGPNWGSGAYDPRSGLYIINTAEVASVEQMLQRPDGRWYNPAGGDSWFADNTKKWMCHTPPWGQLTAVDLNGGRIAWQVPLGVTDALPAAEQATGRPNVGGPIITAGGLTFVGATDDSRFRAFETRTGKEVWTVKLGASAHSTPITYTGKSGKQYVAVVAAGGSYLASPTPTSDLVVYALP